MKYSSFPSASRFQKDSSVIFAFRKEDLILTRIDWLLEHYEKVNTSSDLTLLSSTRRVVLCELFLTCNFWLNNCLKNFRLLTDRYPAVLALREAVVDQLVCLLGCNRAQVPEILDEIYGRDLTTVGIRTDCIQKQAKYLSKLERQDYRLRFKGGRVYQFQWWLPKPPPWRVPANSCHAYESDPDKVIRRGGFPGSVNFGGFIMTMERELYMAKHTITAPHSQAGMFHSSYTSGERVIMAGTMLIVGGIIQAIRSDSGHYKPTEQNMAALLQALLMYGVDLDKIKLFDHEGNELETAGKFLLHHVSWDQYLVQQAKERQNRVASDRLRLALQPPTPSAPVVTDVGGYNVTT